MVKLEALVRAIPRQHTLESLRGVPSLSEMAKTIGKLDPEKLKVEIVRNHLDVVEQNAKRLGLNSVQRRINRIREYLKTINVATVEARGDARMAMEIRILREALEDDLQELLAFYPTPNQQQFHGQEKLFGDAVYEAFESARNDIMAAGNCYATDNFTACVFHSIRVAEHGMRALAINLKIKKVGKHPLPYAEWGQVIQALRTKIETIRRTTRGPKKGALLQFYSGATDQVDHINDIWRTNVAHARGLYNGPEALSALTRVREFMQLLAERLREK